MIVLDLFSGIGGFALGLQWAGFPPPVAFCEVDPFCQRVLKKHWPDVPIHSDIRELTADAVGPVQLICGGPPCQPASRAGQQRGAADDRWLWGEALRLVEALRPGWVLFENPPGIYDVGLAGILAALEGFGYANATGERGEPIIYPLEVGACAAGAPHIRQRVWIVAHATKQRKRSGFQGNGQLMAGSEPWRDLGKARRMADARSIRCEQREHAREVVCAPETQSEYEPRIVSDRAFGSGAGSSMADAIGAGPQERAGERRDDGPERPAPERGRGLGDAEKLRSSSGLGVESGGREAAEPERSAPWSSAEWLWCEFDGKWRRTQPGLRLLAPGVSGRVARLRALGNAVVPQVVAEIGRAILEADRP